MEAATPKQRALQRRSLGTLRELTVQPATKRRYDRALDAFFDFLRENSLQLPTQKQRLDPLVCDYLEYLWATGCGRGQANDTVAALQNQQPSVKGHLQGAWRLLKTWSVNEIPNRAPPLPEQVVWAMSGWSFFHGHYSFGVSLLLGFYTMLRSGELLGLTSADLLCAPKERQVLVSLGLTKAGKRHGAAESVVLGVEHAVTLVKRWKQLASSSTPFTPSPAKWRTLFADCLQALGLQDYGFRPYSLRRGGATWWFSKHQSLDRILIQGRWSAIKTARIYLNEGLAMLARTSIDLTIPQRKSYLKVYHATLRSPNFTALEPSVSTERSGGRGRRVQKSTVRKHIMKRNAFISFSSTLNSFFSTRFAGVWPCIT